MGLLVVMPLSGFELKCSTLLQSSNALDVAISGPAPHHIAAILLSNGRLTITVISEIFRRSNLTNSEAVSGSGTP
jgi:hypothetical protein